MPKRAFRVSPSVRKKDRARFSCILNTSPSPSQFSFPLIHHLTSESFPFLTQPVPFGCDIDFSSCSQRKGILSSTSLSLLPAHLACARSPTMAEKIAIDKNTFFNHLSNLYASWKADKRSGNALFGGAGAIVILMGKTRTDESAFQKNNAMHVSIQHSLIRFLADAGDIDN